MPPRRVIHILFTTAVCLLLAPSESWAQPGESEIAEQERAGEAVSTNSRVPSIRRRSATDFGRIVVNPDFNVSKVHSYLNLPGKERTGNDALDFEQRYWSWGGITREEQQMREGRYFVISWANKRPEPGDFVARFEYRQQGSKDSLKTLEIPHKQVKGTVRSTFAVLGKSFLSYGDVISWRFTVWDGDTLVAEETSFVW